MSECQNFRIFNNNYNHNNQPSNLCNNGLDYYDKLKQQRARVSDQANGYYEQASCYLENAIQAFQKANNMRSQSANIATLMNQWLSQCGEQYGLRPNDPQCIAILKEVSNFKNSMVIGEDKGFALAQQSLLSLNESISLLPQYNILKEQYRNCIYSNNCNCCCNYKCYK